MSGLGRVSPTLRARVGQARMLQASGRFLESPYASMQLLLASGGGLIFFGLLMSASTTISAAQHTTGDAPYAQLIREVGFLVLSVPVFWLAVRLSPTAYRRLAYPSLVLALVALIAVLIPHVGAVINGANRWILIGPLTVQPSEFAKLALLLWGADLLARKEHLKSLDSLRHVLVPVVPGFVAVMALVMAEPDLGTTLCFVLLLLGLLWTVGLPYRYFALLLLVAAGGVTVLAVTESYRLQRLVTFLHPGDDAGATGFQTLHGLQALASGGVFGVGLGRGTLKYGWVPNANTDYVFSVVGEELGLLGGLAVLILFGVFCFAAMRVAGRCQDPFVRLVASGAAIWIAGQALINIGYVTALLPVTGIPLPFISNGGTSLVLTCGVFGMLVSFARHEPAAVAASAAARTERRTAWWVHALRLAHPKPIPKPKARPAKSAPAGPGETRPREARPSASTANPVKANRAKADPAKPIARLSRSVGPTPPQPVRATTRTPRSQPPRDPRLRPTGSDSPGRRR